jgi:DNA-binding transcriptional ArsR family regulator
MAMSRPAMSRQLRLLREAELVIGRRDPIDRRQRFYSVNARRVGAILAWLAGTEIARPSRDPSAAAGILTPMAEGRDIPPDPDGDH